MSPRSLYGSCARCGDDLPMGGPANKKFCSTECRLAEEAEKYRFNSAELGLPKKTVGAMSEVLAWYKLMRMGWDVYRAISPAAPCDLIAFKEGRKLRIEVRTGYRREGSPDGKLYYPKKAIDEGRSEHYAVVLHETEEVIFIPPILE